MPRLSVNPPVRNPACAGSFIQTITATEKGKEIGKAVWFSSPTQPGTVQVLSIEIEPTRQRQGIGSQLMVRVLEESQKRSKLLNAPLRRIWVLVEQKTQITARGFLTRHGFHHVKTIDSLYKDEAAMAYVKSFD